MKSLSERRSALEPIRSKKGRRRVIKEKEEEEEKKEGDADFFTLEHFSIFCKKKHVLVKSYSTHWKVIAAVKKEEMAKGMMEEEMVQEKEGEGGDRPSSPLL